MTTPQPHPGPGAPDHACAAPFGRVEMSILALGIGLRLLLLLTGRAHFDGDEAIMGIMGRDASTFDRLPLYFLRQHYMGTLEVPLVTLLQWLGPAAWDYSVWPVRIAQFVYFGFLGWAHFKLASRFFGRRVARWSLFFICVGPIYWMDYSSRLRHVTLMMALGESIAWMTVVMMDRWRDEFSIHPREVFALGALIGLAWWHYQQILVFVIPAFLVLACFSPFVLDWFRASPASVVRIALFAGSLIALAGLSAGWGEAYWERFPLIIGGELAFFGCVAAWAWFDWRNRIGALDGSDAQTRDRMKSRADHALSPLLLSAGFILGYAPALVHMATLDQEFWVGSAATDTYRFMSRLRDQFVLDYSAMFELIAPTGGRLDDYEPTWRTYFYMLLYGAGFYLLMRKLARPDRRAERVGAFFFLAVFAATSIFKLIIPRSTFWTEPRFLVPAFATSSVALGLVFAAMHDLLGQSRWRWRRQALGAAPIMAGLAVIGLWSGRWIDAEVRPIDWPSGHEATMVELIEGLNEHGIERIVVSAELNWIAFGYQVAFASRMRIRCNRGVDGDRLYGLLDESRYSGYEYLVSTRTGGGIRRSAQTLIDPGVLSSSAPRRGNAVQEISPDGPPPVATEEDALRIGEFHVFLVPDWYIVRSRRD